MSNTRPCFSFELSIHEFEQHYWYKRELIEICRCNHIPAWGTKAELEQRIKKLLNGEEVISQRTAGKAERMKKEMNELSLHTRLIPDGFKFNQLARDFFARYYKKEKFSFTKEMAAALREAEKQCNTEMTVADLIAIYEGKRAINTIEERTYQWNNFVREFSKDPNSYIFKKNRMKVAAILWKEIRDKPGEKKYTPDLLEAKLEQLKRFQ